MIAITWTPKLMETIKELKKLDKSKIVSLFNDRKYLDSLQLSVTEEQAVSSVVTRDISKVSTSQDRWY